MKSVLCEAWGLYMYSLLAEAQEAARARDSDVVDGQDVRLACRILGYPVPGQF